MNFLKWLLCFLVIPAVIILLFILVTLFIRYHSIMIPLSIIGVWVYVAIGLHKDWF